MQSPVTRELLISWTETYIHAQTKADWGRQIQPEKGVHPLPIFQHWPDSTQAMNIMAQKICWDWVRNGGGERLFLPLSPPKAAETAPRQHWEGMSVKGEGLHGLPLEVVPHSSPTKEGAVKPRLLSLMRLLPLETLPMGSHASHAARSPRGVEETSGALRQQGLWGVGSCVRYICPSPHMVATALSIASDPIGLGDGRGCRGGEGWSSLLPPAPNKMTWQVPMTLLGPKAQVQDWVRGF